MEVFIMKVIKGKLSNNRLLFTIGGTPKDVNKFIDDIEKFYSNYNVLVDDIENFGSYICYANIIVG